jgi:hypothetical protein
MRKGTAVQIAGLGWFYRDLGPDVLAGGQPHGVDPGGRLVHSGVLFGLVGQLV